MQQKIKQVMIAPSILSADFSDMGKAVSQLRGYGASLVHCDVMDGVFVPNITFGVKMIADIKKCTDLPLDVHLMIVSPENFLDKFIDAGADYLTFHVEATNNAADCLRHIKSRGVKSGIVISPDTPISKLEGLLSLCDMALLMSVYPGFGGQKFIEGSLQRLRQLKALSLKENPNMLIEIDGGVTLENAADIVAAGADVLVAGNTVFTASNPTAAVAALKGCK